MHGNPGVKACSAVCSWTVLQEYQFVQGCHGFPVEFACHRRSWMQKNNCLILQLVLILVWDGFASLGSQIKYILNVRKWLFIFTYCMKCLIIHSWKLAKCDYSPRYINSSWCFTALPQEKKKTKTLVQNPCRAFKVIWVNIYQKMDQAFLPAPLLTEKVLFSNLL